MKVFAEHAQPSGPLKPHHLLPVYLLSPCCQPCDAHEHLLVPCQFTVPSYGAVAITFNYEGDYKQNVKTLPRQHKVSRVSIIIPATNICANTPPAAVFSKALDRFSRKQFSQSIYTVGFT